MEKKSIINVIKQILFHSVYVIIVLCSWFIVSSVYNHFFFMTYIQGNSMSPTLKNGSLVLLKKTTKPNVNDIVVFSPPEKWVLSEEKIVKNDLFIKRIVAGPDDVIKIEKDKFYVNEKIVKEKLKKGTTEGSYKLKKYEYFVVGDGYPFSTDSLSLVYDGVHLDYGTITSSDIKNTGTILLGKSK